MSKRCCLALVLHDVAPVTWPAYADFVDQVDALGPIPLTLLVVPDFHGRAPLDRHPDFVRLLQQRAARGDELVLHGYYHHDPGPVPLRPREWVARRMLTHEGEFYPLPEQTARERLEKGLSLMQRLDLPTQGFVPPAWLLGPAARKVLAEFPFRYTSNPAGLLRLPDFQPLPSPTLVWSARSAWRRWASKRWNQIRLRRQADAPLLRLGLHPVDMQHPQARHYWLDTLERLLSDRQVVTKSQWLESQLA